MVNLTCSLCKVMRRSQHMHSQKRTTFTDEYHYVFKSQKNEGSLCNYCYNIMYQLKEGHNLVSTICTHISVYSYI
jgi:hypothetical protein